MEKIKQFILDIFFPKFCLNCNREGNYICSDCFSLIDILEKQNRQIISAVSYKDNIVKTVIHQFKYGPCIKELAKPLSALIGAHFLNYDKLPFDLKESVLAKDVKAGEGDVALKVNGQAISVALET